jgi:hypothetical protein
MTKLTDLPNKATYDSCYFPCFDEHGRVSGHISFDDFTKQIAERVNQLQLDKHLANKPMPPFIENDGNYYKVHTSENDWLEFDNKEEAEQYLMGLK